MIPSPSRYSVLAFALIVGFAPALLAQNHVLTLNPQESQVTFLLGATGHDVEGTLHMKSGELHLQVDDRTASGKVTLDALKTDTGSKRRDKKMHSEVLESERHPLIVFEAQRWTGEVASQGKSEIEVIGTMTLVGKSHPMTLPIQFEVDGDRLSGQSTFTVPFIEWGLRDPSILFLSVDKEVEVTVEAIGQLATTPAVAEEPEEPAADGTPERDD